MQETSISQPTLREFYMQVILPQFGLMRREIVWLDHKVIGPDNDMHTFLANDEQYALVYDDYPTITAKQVSDACDRTRVTQVRLDSVPDGSDRFVLKFSPNGFYAHNISGYFQLFRIHTPLMQIRVLKLKARRQARHRDSIIIQSLVDTAAELATQIENGVDLRSISALADASCRIARHHQLGSLEKFFYDLSKLDHFCEMDKESSHAYTSRVTSDLQSIIERLHLLPDVTSKEHKILNRHALPIHTKMVDTPDKSPDYFIELASVLNDLVLDDQITEWAAALELSHALDRPQIIEDKKLEAALIKAYELELPGTQLREHPRTQWDAFFDEIQSIRR